MSSGARGVHLRLPSEGARERAATTHTYLQDYAGLIQRSRTGKFGRQHRAPASSLLFFLPSKDLLGQNNVRAKWLRAAQLQLSHTREESSHIQAWRPRATHARIHHAQCATLCREGTVRLPHGCLAVSHPGTGVQLPSSTTTYARENNRKRSEYYLILFFLSVFSSSSSAKGR